MLRKFEFTPGKSMSCLPQSKGKAVLDPRAAKGGVYAFSRALAQLGGAADPGVNVLGPGWIETAYGSGLDPALKQRISAKIPLGRWARPEDIAHAAVYLASDSAAYVTGQM